MSTPLVQETTAKRQSIRWHVELSGMLPVPVKMAGMWRTVPVGGCILLLLGLLAGQLVDLSGPVHVGDSRGELEFFPTVHPQITIGLVFPIVLMGWRIQEHQSKDIQVPHAIDAREKGTVHLDRDAAPLPMAFSHLTNNEEDDSHGSTGQGDEHEELEPEN